MPEPVSNVMGDKCEQKHAQHRKIAVGKIQFGDDARSNTHAFFINILPHIGAAPSHQLFLVVSHKAEYLSVHERAEGA